MFPVKVSHLSCLHLEAVAVTLSIKNVVLVRNYSDSPIVDDIKLVLYFHINLFFQNVPKYAWFVLYYGRFVVYGDYMLRRICRFGSEFVYRSTVVSFFQLF